MAKVGSRGWLVLERSTQKKFAILEKSTQEKDLYILRDHEGGYIERYKEELNFHPLFKDIMKLIFGAIKKRLGI